MQKDLFAMKKGFIIAAVLLGTLACMGQNPEVRWHDEANDTTRIAEMLNEAAQLKLGNASARTAWFGRQLIGKPYVAHTLEGETEALTVNLDELDCTTFVETAMALAFTLGENRLGWQDFVYNLRRLRYRKGEVNGYASRLHYNCDWAMDNIHRGNFVDLTREFEQARYMVRTIDYMSGHRDSYSALKDSTEYERIRGVENGYRNHRFPYIKSGVFGDKKVEAKLREGDVLAFVSNLKDLDVTHMGMLVKGDDGKFHVLHASSSNGKVEISDDPLHDFLKRNRQWIGARIFRLKD